MLQKAVNYLTYFIGLLIGIINKGEKKSKCIIIVRTDNIGDYILFAPFLKYIRQKFNNYQITLILKDSVVALADDCPYVDRIIVFNDRKYRRNLFYKVAFLWKLSKGKFDICLYPAYSRERIGDEMALWTAANQKIAWDSEPINMTCSEKVRGDRIYTTLIKSNSCQLRHESERSREFLQHLEIQVDELLTEVWGLAGERRKIRELLARNAAEGRPIVVIAPGAFANYRKWGFDKLNTLMRRLYESYKQIFFIIVGTAHENEGLKSPINENRERNYLDLCGQTNLKELLAVLECSQVVVGNETGTLHLAIAAGVPTVCILGGGQFGRFMPYGDPAKHKYVYKKMDCFNCNWQCIQGNAKCINDITVDNVLDGILSLLNKNYELGQNHGDCNLEE